MANSWSKGYPEAGSGFLIFFGVSLPSGFSFLESEFCQLTLTAQAWALAWGKWWAKQAMKKMSPFAREYAHLHGLSVHCSLDQSRGSFCTHSVVSSEDRVRSVGSTVVVPAPQTVSNKNPCWIIVCWMNKWRKKHWVLPGKMAASSQRLLNTSHPANPVPKRKGGKKANPDLQRSSHI